MGIYTEKRDQLIEKIKVLEKRIASDTAKKKTLEDKLKEVSRLAMAEEYNCKATEEMDIDSTEVYGEVVREMVVYDDCRLDVYLHCVPFGFRLHYIKGKKPFGKMQIITVDECTTI